MTAVKDSPDVSPAPPLAAAPLPTPAAASPSWSDLLLLFAHKFGLPFLAFVLALWDAGLLFIMMALMPKNEFGRTFLSAVAFVRGEDMYAMNESVPWWVGYT